jgi:hypothetical protein
VSNVSRRAQLRSRLQDYFSTLSINPHTFQIGLLLFLTLSRRAIRLPRHPVGYDIFYLSNFLRFPVSDYEYRTGPDPIGCFRWEGADYFTAETAVMFTVCNGMERRPKGDEL